MKPFSVACFFTFVISCSTVLADQSVAPEYETKIAPLFNKYCAGCHNDVDREGDFSLATHASLRKGTLEGPVVIPGDAANSRLVRLITGEAEPAMPPEGEPKPNENELLLIKTWIDQGAVGPRQVPPSRLSVDVPDIAPATDSGPVTAIDVSSDGMLLAVARFREVSLYDVSSEEKVDFESPVLKLDQFPGKVTSVHFDANHARLIVASGIAGLGGIASLWNIDNASLIREYRGHHDILYDAELSPDGSTLATCGYDKTIQLWNVDSGQSIRTLTGHNGAVYDVAFRPDGKFLVSASADDTCKVWRVADGLRLDTLGQPLNEAYSCQFSPDGDFIVASGADKTIRVWRFVSHDRPRINPMVYARFAHEGPVVRLVFTGDGSRLVTVAEDRTIKVWDTSDYSELRLWDNQAAVAMALATRNSDTFFVGRMDGTLSRFPIPPVAHARERLAAPIIPKRDVSWDDDSRAKISNQRQQDEREPNNRPSQALAVDVPVKIRGKIHGDVGGEADFDLYRFAARKGQQWVIEVDAYRSDSPLDSFIEILGANGGRMERVLLQAVRESYFTFRGKNDSTVDDFRVFGWEEMKLNELLYANGEVVKLWVYPRGPDSGFMVYPGQGERWGYFDTTPLAHALGEPCYIVRAYRPGTRLIPNGLPVFPIYFENDDDARRQLHTDSRLFFTPLHDGEFLVKIKDVRGFEGADYTYELSIRPRKPDFKVKLTGENLSIGPGGAKEFTVTAERIDRFDGPIRVDIDNLPPGFTATTPLIIEAGQIEALGVIAASHDAPPPSSDVAKASTITATATISDREITHPVNNFGELKLGSKPKLQIKIVATDDGVQPSNDSSHGPLEFQMRPGETIELKAVVQRNGFDGRIQFGTQGSGRNLPFGAYIDNLGLNGLLVRENEDDRAFFVTADPCVAPQSRTFHIKTDAADGHASRAVLLRVQP